MNLVEDMTALATAAKNAARLMPPLNTDQKNLCLNTMADAVEAQAEPSRLPMLWIWKRRVK